MICQTWVGPSKSVLIAWSEPNVFPPYPPVWSGRLELLGAGKRVFLVCFLAFFICSGFGGIFYGSSAGLCGYADYIVVIVCLVVGSLYFFLA